MRDAVFKQHIHPLCSLVMCSTHESNIIRLQATERVLYRVEAGAGSWALVLRQGRECERGGGGGVGEDQRVWQRVQPQRMVIAPVDRLRLHRHLHTEQLPL